MDLWTWICTNKRICVGFFYHFRGASVHKREVTFDNQNSTGSPSCLRFVQWQVQYRFFPQRVITHNSPDVAIGKETCHHYEQVVCGCSGRPAHCVCFVTRSCESPCGHGFRHVASVLSVSPVDRGIQKYVAILPARGLDCDAVQPIIWTRMVVQDALALWPTTV